LEYALSSVRRLPLEERSGLEAFVCALVQEFWILGWRHCGHVRTMSSQDERRCPPHRLAFQWAFEHELGHVLMLKNPETARVLPKVPETVDAKEASWFAYSILAGSAV